MKTKTLLLSLFLFTSCSKNNAPIDCYQCFLGNMIVSSISMDYSSINKKQIQHDDFILDKDYYSNYYVINNNVELNNFYSNNELNIDENEKNRNLSFDEENKSRCYFINQIPKGYKAYKRNNVQQELKDESIVLITTNFYYYLSNTDISYCYIDIKKDDSVKEDYIYSFFYEYDKYYANIIKNNSIRIIYNLED